MPSLYGVTMNEDEYTLIVQKHARPRLLKDGEWDGVSILVYKRAKDILRPGHWLIRAIYKLWDAGYLFHEPQKKAKGMCFFPSCDKRGTHPHHVTYQPVCVKRLCPQHHRDITVCNINASEGRGKLSNGYRWHIWSQWLKGEVQPHMTPSAERWLSTWRD